MITLEMVRAGFNSGIIRLIEEDGVVCNIGDNWFFFDSKTVETMTVEEYLNAFSADEITEKIYTVLEEFRTEFEDEYLYYEYVLREKIRDSFILNNPDGVEGFQLTDKFMVDEKTSIYTVSLAHGFYVDVKVSDETNLCYIMQNHDGSTVYGIAGSDASVPGYTYNEDAVIRFVKEIHSKEKNLFTEDKVYYHVTLLDNVTSIREKGLIPQIGERSLEAKETDNAVYLFKSKGDMENALMDWLGDWYCDVYGEEYPLAILEVRLPADISIINNHTAYEVLCKSIIPSSCISFFDEHGKSLDDSKETIPGQKKECCLSKNVKNGGEIMIEVDHRITYDEINYDEENQTVTLYFKGPKELINDKFRDAEFMLISIEFPKNHIEPYFGEVSFSPVDSTGAYYWYDVSLPYEEIEALLSLAEKENYRISKETLSFTNIVDNMADCLSRAQERIRELGDVSPELPYVTDDMLLIDDITQCLEECSDLYEFINNSMHSEIQKTQKHESKKNYEETVHDSTPKKSLTKQIQDASSVAQSKSLSADSKTNEQEQVL